MIYAINTILIFVYNILTLKIKKWKNIALLLSFITMTLIVVCRGSGVGADYFMYNQIYNSVIELPLLDGIKIIDPGYALICYISNFLIPGNTWLVHFFMGFFTMMFFYLSIRKISLDYFLSVYLFVSMGFLYNVMTQQRQCLAMSLVSYALHYFINQKKGKFFVFVLLASTFHTSALIMLLLFIPEFFCIFKQSRFLTVMFFLLLIFLAYTILPIKLFLEFFNITRFLPYLTYNSSLQLSVVANTLLRIIITLLVFFSYRRVTKRKPESKVLYFMVAFMFVFQIAALKVSIVARITTYFYMALIYLVPIIFQEVDVKVSNKKINKQIKIIFILLLMPYHYIYFIFQYMVQSNSLIPYYSIFDSIF